MFYETANKNSLEEEIRELENTYAECFIEGIDPDILADIYFKIQDLRKQTNTTSGAI